MMSPEILPAQNEAAIRACAPLFGNAALKKWFQLIPPEAHLSPRSARLETDEGQAAMVVRGAFGRFSKSNRLQFEQLTDDGPYQVTLSPKCFNSIFNKRRDGADIDLLANYPVAWRQPALNILELISVGSFVGTRVNPYTAHVKTQVPLTVEVAEQRLLGIRDFMQQYQQSAAGAVQPTR